MKRNSIKRKMRELERHKMEYNNHIRSNITIYGSSISSNNLTETRIDDCFREINI